MPRRGRHGGRRGQPSVLTWLSGQDVEAVLSVGDIVDGAGDHDRCCALLRAHAAIVVRGNHERAMLANPFACQSRFTPRCRYAPHADPARRDDAVSWSWRPRRASWMAKLNSRAAMRSDPGCRHPLSSALVRSWGCR